jgi:hypothetical protein
LLAKIRGQLKRTKADGDFAANDGFCSNLPKSAILGVHLLQAAQHLQFWVSQKKLTLYPNLRTATVVS